MMLFKQTGTLSSIVLTLMLLLTGCNSSEEKGRKVEADQLTENDKIKSASIPELEVKTSKSTIDFDSITIEERVSLLEKHLSTLANADSKQIFFEAFPGTFEEFTMIFGYYGKIDEFGLHENIGILAETSSDYIDAFFGQSSVPKSTFVNKVLDITERSEWQGDGVSILQGSINSLSENNLSLVVLELQKRDEGEVKDFWRFYYAGPHPESYQERFNALQPKVSAIDQRIGSLFKEVYEEVLAGSDGHGN